MIKTLLTLFVRSTRAFLFFPRLFLEGSFWVSILVLARSSNDEIMQVPWRLSLINLIRTSELTHAHALAALTWTTYCQRERETHTHKKSKITRPNQPSTQCH
jgi:hypothetical protein